ncbi:MAG: glyoxalase [Lachnospiraceae bacterium]|nr:glyoxalase [Lachnospiraceae bacterium]
MEGYEKECVEVLLKEQERIFGERVAENYDEAIEFLEDCFAVVLSNAKEIREYWDECGIDAEGMSDDDILEADEVIALPSGKYMVLEV